VPQWLSAPNWRSVYGASTRALGADTTAFYSCFPQVLTIEGFSLGVNCGCDRVRFTSPVPVGSRVRASVLVDQAAEVKGGVQLTLTCTFEIEGSERPACVATWITRALI
jgi:acyl dehydratase